VGKYAIKGTIAKGGSMPKIDAVIQKLDETRGRVLALLPQVEGIQEKEVYPGWTIKEMLAHMSGWDDLVIDFAAAFARGEQPFTPAYRMIDEYNAESVETRVPLDYTQVYSEFIKTRARLIEVLQGFPDEKFEQSFLLPWGDQGNVSDLAAVFIHHDGQHAEHIKEWLQDPSKALVGKH
jgi:hypothetical protein